jgi:hypothetical protein
LVGDVDAEDDANAEERQRHIDVNTMWLKIMGPLVDRKVKHGRLPDGNLFWVSDRVFVDVRFENDRVITVAAVPARRADEAVLDRLRRWLGL